MGIVLFGEYPDLYTIIGSMIVIGSGLYTLYRERIKSSAKPASRAAPRHSP